ncbi:MAG: thiamine pyrophosphate-dependent enzyme [Methanomicrobiales archaeon]|nr:thiamine pyrophosphate-dependent enzyme [Methanomicrobiales archaeon]
MTERQLITDSQNTWCPGCGNFSLEYALRDVFNDLEKEGIPLEKIVLVTGIGCHAKMADYLDVNSFYAIHGRTIPVATGIKLARPDLTVVCCAGDGDAYAEGLDHLIFGAKRNLDITVIIHNNRVYGLTTGQYTPTSPLGFKGRSTPEGTQESPINPLELMLTSGATYIGRGYTKNLKVLRLLIKEAILHKGFSFVDVLQICATYFDVHEIYDTLVYELEKQEAYTFEEVMKKIREWDYNGKAPIGLGTYYRKEAPTFDERIKGKKISEEDREKVIQQVLEKNR